MKKLFKIIIVIAFVLFAWSVTANVIQRKLCKSLTEDQREDLVSENFFGHFVICE